MDINSLRERLTQMNKKTTKDTGIWKPKDEHQVRLTQKPGSTDDPLRELSFHNEIGLEQPILCPKANFGDECSICDFCELLRAWKDPSGKDKPEGERKADWELFKKIQAKARVYSLMVERNHEAEGARWWSMTPAQTQQALDVCLDGDRLQDLGVDKDDGKGALRVLFDPDKGYDLTVSFAKPQEKGNSKNITVITIKGKIRSSPLLKDMSGVEKLFDNVKPLSEIYPRVSSDDVDKLFRKYLGSGALEAKPEGGKEKYPDKESAPKSPARPTNSKENSKLSGTRSIDEAFGDLVSDDA